MLEEIKIWWRLRPLIADLKEQLRRLSMPNTLKGNVWFSVVLIVLQMVIQLTDYAPPKWKVVALVAQVGYEAVQKIRNLFFNPDGTPAAVAYVKDQK